MITTNIVPHQGIDGIAFGDDRDHVLSILGHPNFEERRHDHFFDSLIQVHYDHEGKVEFIELYADDPETIVVNISNLSAFEATKNELREGISTKLGAEPDIDDPEYPTSYTYRDLDLGFWSDSDPTDFTEEEKNAYPDDYEASKYFKSVGIGRRGYYA